MAEDGNCTNDQTPTPPPLKRARRTKPTQERLDVLQMLGYKVCGSDKTSCEIRWNARLKELEEYRSIYGDCLVPLKYKENPQLGRWISNQRQQYKLMEEGKPSRMTKERIAALDKIGFTWCCGQPTDSWEVRLQELKNYKAQYGHCHVPQRFQKNLQLGRWVRTQRTQHRLLREGKVSSMTEERVAALESVGFEWGSEGQQWETRLEELRLFKETFGDCNVPFHYKDNPQLGRWVSTQRKQFRLRQEGKQCQISDERICALDELGFVWRIRDGVDWTGRLDQLLSFKQQHGHCNVPTHYGENPQLGRWVSSQRKQYNRLRQGRPSHMTPERMKILDMVGFVWSMKRTGSSASEGEDSNDAPEALIKVNES